jgi:hypothetical protein
VYRVRANGPRGAVHLHTADELSPAERADPEWTAP